MAEEMHTKARTNASNEEETISFKKTTLWKVGTFLFLGLFVISLFTGGFGLKTTGTGNVIVNNNDPGTVVAPTGDVKVSITDADPVLGDKNADITIVEFSDFQCPFCGRAYSDAIAQFKQSDYFKNGDVNLVYKHFPLNSIHPYAEKAAEAAECANMQGKFWEYHNMLFENQETLDVASLKSYASKVGLDTTKFNKCLDGGEAVAKINKDLAEAAAAGGRGTPYFVLINGDGETTTVSGAVPYSNFEAAIQSLQ